MGYSFNLLDQRWLPIIRNNGSFEKVGIREALLQAGRIRQIAASNPMDQIALLRFLLACLQWCKEAISPQEIDSLNAAEGIPASWLMKLGAQQDKFYLFGDENGFFQDFSVRETAELPATYLLPELPTAANIAHFRHTRDFCEGLCPACCSMGLIRFSAYATPTSKGSAVQMPAAINGGRPTYAVPFGETLFETILLNWPLPQLQEDRPGWMENQAPVADQIGCLAGLTWRPRKVWLKRPEIDAPRATCAYCGDSEHALIFRIAFRPGWKRPFIKEAWPGDPHLLLDVEPPSGRRKNPELNLVSLPKATARADLHARQWRILYATALKSLSQEIAGFTPAQYRHLRYALAKRPMQKVFLTFFGAAVVNQALYQDALYLTWCVPASNLTPENLRMALAELEWLCEMQPWTVLALASPRNARKRPEISAALSSDAAGTESVLRRLFEEFFNELLAGDSDASRKWRSNVRAALSAQIQDVQSSFVTGSLLASKFARVKAHEALSRVFVEPNNASAKARSGRHAKEGNDDSD